MIETLVGMLSFVCGLLDVIGTWLYLYEWRHNTNFFSNYSSGDSLRSVHLVPFKSFGLD